MVTGQLVGDEFAVGNRFTLHKLEDGVAEQVRVVAVVEAEREAVRRPPYAASRQPPAATTVTPDSLSAA